MGEMSAGGPAFTNRVCGYIGGAVPVPRARNEREIRVMKTVEVFPDASALARGAAEAVIDAAERAVRASGRFTWCLAGGHTPRPLYELLATDELARRIEWGRAEVFFGDERCVAPDDEQSNYRMAREALLDRVPLPADHVHRIEAERERSEAVARYDAVLRRYLGVEATGSPSTGFDLVLLGMGEDGHTASLFPDSVDDASQWVSARMREAAGQWRITLTPTVFDAAREVRFLVSGPGKAQRLVDVILGTPSPDRLPAQRIAPSHGDVTWMVDRAAAAMLLSAGERSLRDGGIRVEMRT